MSANDSNLKKTVMSEEEVDNCYLSPLPAMCQILALLLELTRLVFVLLKQRHTTNIRAAASAVTLDVPFSNIFTLASTTDQALTASTKTTNYDIPGSVSYTAAFTSTTVQSLSTCHAEYMCLS